MPLALAIGLAIAFLFAGVAPADTGGPPGTAITASDTGGPPGH